MKIGILGGTFDPPHIGHLILGEEVRETLGLDKILFIPTFIPPHKEKGSSALHRFNMVKLAINDNKYFEIVDLEIKRGGVSYTIDTVRELKRLYPNDEFFLLIGSDLANTFSSWKDFDKLKKEVQIVVVQREEAPLKENNDFLKIDISQIDVSSSQIRERFKKGLSIRYLVPEGVEEYIRKNKLYK